MKIYSVSLLPSVLSLLSGEPGIIRPVTSLARVPRDHFLKKSSTPILRLSQKGVKRSWRRGLGREALTVGLVNSSDRRINLTATAGDAHCALNWKEWSFRLPTNYHQWYDRRSNNISVILVCGNWWVAIIIECFFTFLASHMWKLVGCYNIEC